MERHGTVCCIATGPSLTEADCQKARKAEKVIAINDAYRLCPDADILYACDEQWWRYHLPAVRASGFAGELWTQYEGEDSSEVKYARDNGLFAMVGTHGKGLGKDRLHYGNNSGYQAINLAWLKWQPKRILLIGYDMSIDGSNKRHFFGDHPPPMNVCSDYRCWIPVFLPLAVDLAHEGVEVINCSRRTELTAFKRGDLDVLL